MYLSLNTPLPSALHAATSLLLQSEKTGKLTIVRRHWEKTNLKPNINSKYKIKNALGFLNNYLKGHKTSFKQTDRDDGQLKYNQSLIN